MSTRNTGEDAACLHNYCGAFGEFRSRGGQRTHLRKWNALIAGIHDSRRREAFSLASSCAIDQLALKKEVEEDRPANDKLIRDRVAAEFSRHSISGSPQWLVLEYGERLSGRKRVRSAGKYIRLARALGCAVRVSRFWRSTLR